jgi:hypothetical protein
MMGDSSSSPATLGTDLDHELSKIDKPSTHKRGDQGAPTARRQVSPGHR